MRFAPLGDHRLDVTLAALGDGRTIGGERQPVARYLNAYARTAG